jgi:MEMO1 family protein
MEAKKTRERKLPAGWYPDSMAKIRLLTEEWSRQLYSDSDFSELFSCVVPHAGWSFSGHLVWKALAQIKETMSSGPDTVIIIGGHLAPGAGVLAARETLFQVPGGSLELDRELLQRVMEHLSASVTVRTDTFIDNSVEVHLPLVALMFPETRVIWLRTGSGEESIVLGRVLADAVRDLNKNGVVIGSTDLTHYGPAYGFTSQGSGNAAYRWVRDVNDNEIIRVMESMDSKKVLHTAQEKKSACSAGAAAAAIEFAKASGAKNGMSIGYENSYSKAPGASFVGYTSIIYGR